MALTGAHVADPDATGDVMTLKLTSTTRRRWRRSIARCLQASRLRQLARLTRGRGMDLHARQQQCAHRAGAQCRRHADRYLHGARHGRRQRASWSTITINRRQRRGGDLRHGDRRGDRSRRRRQRHAGHADRDRHSDRHRRRQSGQHLPGGRAPARRATSGYGSYTMTAAGDLDLHARQQQRGGAGAQCRRHADRHLHGAHPGRHRAARHHHHPRRQRCGGDSGTTTGTVTEAGGVDQRHAGHADRDRRR